VKQVSRSSASFSKQPSSIRSKKFEVSGLRVGRRICTYCSDNIELCKHFWDLEFEIAPQNNIHGDCSVFPETSCFSQKLIRLIF
jgi:hypothetical protein